MSRILLITDKDKTEYYVCTNVPGYSHVLRRSSDPLLRQTVRKFDGMASAINPVVKSYIFEGSPYVKADLIEMPAWMEVPELPTVRPVGRVVDFGYREGWLAQGFVLQWAQGFPYDLSESKCRNRYVGEYLYTLADALAVVQGKAKLEVLPEEKSDKMTWAEIVELVGEVTGSKAKFNADEFSGHDMTGINYNSLARIIDAVRTGKKP